MKLNKLSLIFFLLSNVATIFMKTIEHEINLIENYVKQEQIPKNIIFYSCWTTKNSVKLMGKLANNNAISFRATFNFSKVDFHKPKKRPALIISSAHCKDLNILIKKCEELHLLQTPFQWLILNGTSTVFDLNKEILLNTNFAVTTPESARKEIDVKSIYKTSENSTSFTENHLGTYSTTNNSFRNYRPLVIGIDRMDLMGAKIRTSFVFPNKESQDFNYESYRREDIYTSYKIYYSAVYTILPSLNASAIDRIHSTWGHKSANSTKMTGMYSDLQDDLSEIGAHVGYMNPERIEYADFLGIISPNNLKFVFRKPPLSTIENLFILPFAPTVWFWLYSLLAVLILTYFLLFFIENKMIVTNRKEPQKDSKLLDVVLLQVGAITQQGTETEPKSSSVRIAFFVIFLAFMFFYTAYSANIVVLLQSKSESIKTVKDMLDSKISVGVEDLIYNRYYFKGMTDPVRKAFYEKKIAPKGQKENFYDYNEGIPRMRNEFFAFFFEGSMGYKLIHKTFHEHEICGLTEIEYFNWFKPSLSLRKYTPYKRILRIGFRKFVETGLHNRAGNKLIYVKPPCISDTNNFLSVGIDESYFAFVIFLVGITSAALLLIVEILFQKLLLLWKTKQEQRYPTFLFTP